MNMRPSTEGTELMLQQNTSCINPDAMVAPHNTPWHQTPVRQDTDHTNTDNSQYNITQNPYEDDGSAYEVYLSALAERADHVGARSLQPQQHWSAPQPAEPTHYPEASYDQQSYQQERHTPQDYKNTYWTAAHNQISPQAHTRDNRNIRDHYKISTPSVHTLKRAAQHPLLRNHLVTWR